MDCPSAACIGADSARASTSEGPPGTKGTTMLIGRLGQGSAARALRPRGGMEARKRNIRRSICAIPFCYGAQGATNVPGGRTIRNFDLPPDVLALAACAGGKTDFTPYRVAPYGKAPSLHVDEPIRTQAGIIEAGPAGLFLSHLLKAQRTESVVLEARSRPYVEGRVRAGVLEPGTVETMARLGLDSRLRREGLIDEGLDMRFRGRTIHLNLPGLTDKSVMIYGQQEVVKDLIAARLEAGDPLIFEAQVTRIEGIEGERPRLHYTQNGKERVLDCDFVAGCDGYHGVGRMTQCEQSYGFAWLGVLARARPMADMTFQTATAASPSAAVAPCRCHVSTFRFPRRRIPRTGQIIASCITR
jgi:hypothetical protein